MPFLLLGHQCSLPIVPYPDMLLWLWSLKNRNKSPPLAHIPPWYYPSPLPDHNWIAYIISCAQFLSWPSPWNPINGVSSLSSDPKWPHEDGHPSPSSQSRRIQQSIICAHLTWPCSCLCHSCRTLYFLNIFFTWLLDNYLWLVSHITNCIFQSPALVPQHCLDF